MNAIIVPIKNQFSIVQYCLESLVKNCKDEEIILIDDGSTEEILISMLKDFSEKFSWQLFRNEESIGHTDACNIGIENTKSENMFILNSDTILPKNLITILSEVLNNNDNIGVVGPSSSSASGPQLIKDAFNKRFSMTADNVEKYALEVEKTDNIQDIDLVNGFCFGIKRSVFNKVEGFDKALTCYGNEKEMLIRIRDAGYRTVWVEGSYIHHFGKMSYAQEDLNIGRAQIDADKYIMKKHGKMR